MINALKGFGRAAPMALAAAGVLGSAGLAAAQSAPGAAPPPAGGAEGAALPTDPENAPPAATTDVVVTASKTTRSAISLSGVEIQKILPGANPLRSIETLPGVLFQTADPWGNNEQNEELFVHGFSTQQLGYTMDGIPLGDQQYGNYNGLSPSRALTSENTSKVTLESGAGSLGVASTSNLGGAIETFSVDPSKDPGGLAEQVVGSNETYRTFIRLETGELLGGQAWISYLHQDQKAWDFDGHQRGDQVNLKYVRENQTGRLTLFADWDAKVEPNEDAINYGNQQTTAAQGYVPYTRPFLYPNLQTAEASLTNGTPPAAQGNNFDNYFSAAQRNDALAYVRYDWTLAPNLTWSNTAYYHNDYGRGIVAGPINQAGLPTLFASYFPGLVVGGSATSAGSLGNLVKLFGGSGYEVRTTEYHINREGELSSLDWTLGPHRIELGLWYEHNQEGQHRVWYPFAAANDDLTPYEVPHSPYVFTQYAFQFDVEDAQFHLQDQWKILPQLLLQAGFKSSLQTADGRVVVQQVNLPTNKTPTLYPSGTVVSNEGFLPQLGAVYDVTGQEQVFANIQKNLRQFIPYGAGSNFYGASPWSLASQAAFNLFKSTVQPETSWTYEVGVREHRALDMPFLTSIEGQVNYYHVDFSNRLLNVAPYNFINPPPALLVNVGGVTTNGVDLAATLNFGSHLHLYDAVSYDKSAYDSNYVSGAVSGGAAPMVVGTSGKTVPGEPDWLNKTILSTNFGAFEAQLNGDYVGRRYATYLNDISVKTQFLMGLEASVLILPANLPVLRNAKLAVNVTNLADVKGVSTLVTTSASGGYQGFPIPPRQVFVTLSAAF